MRHWLQLASANWFARPGRAAATVISIALGVGMVVWITSAYESVRCGVTDWVWDWIGRSHLTVESPLGKWGVVDARIGDRVAGMPAVRHLTRRSWWRVYVSPRPGDDGSALADALLGRERTEIEVNGIEPATEYLFRDMPANVVEGGRPLRPGDRGVVVLERALADELGVRVGDRIVLYPNVDALTGTAFEIVGVVERRRISRYQHPAIWVNLEDMQLLIERPDKVTAIDIVLRDGRIDELEKHRADILKITRELEPQASVTTAEAKLRQLENAMGQLELILALISCVAFMTSFFIILSTLSMGMLERLRYLGLLRCVGVTRAQLAVLVPAEVLPLAVLGVIAGVPIGFGLMALTLKFAPEFVGRWAVSPWGLWLACGGGLVTAIAGAMFPTINMLRVTPLVATKPEIERHRVWAEAVAAAVGLSMILSHYLFMRSMDAASDWFVKGAVISLLLLYLGYALVSPSLVLVTGPLSVRIVARLLRVRWQLLRDQVTQAVWRSAAICAGLMVGLSLMVALWVHSEGILQGWQFPKQFPEAYLYAFSTQPGELLPAIENTPGVGPCMAINEFSCEVDPDVERSGFFKWLRPSQRFVAADPSKFPDLVRLEYLEGDEVTALRQLKQGDHVLLTREFARTYQKNVGDPIRIKVGDAVTEFTVAGVVASPAIDIAVGFFGASGEMQFFSVGSVIGTFADAEKYFGRSGFKMLLFNFRLDELPPLPPSLPGDDELALPVESELFDAVDVRMATVENRREQVVFNHVVNRMREREPSVRAVYGSVRVLKGLIDSQFRKVAKIMTAIPLMSLLVAALGVANLMMANVASRQRQIAVMRAVGATRWQMVRLVMGEAIILGMLGSAMGILLGLHLAANSNYVTEKVWGFEPVWTIPWGWVGGAVAITSAACLIAGIFPARLAARSNIVSAMQST
jgi:putative ABC transport system permease protein